MQSGAFFRPGDAIAHVDRDSVSPIGVDGRSGKLSVNEQRTFIDPIGSNEASSDVEVVSGSRSCKNV